MRASERARARGHERARACTHEHTRARTHARAHDARTHVRACTCLRWWQEGTTHMINNHDQRACVLNKNRSGKTNLKASLPMGNQIM